MAILVNKAEIAPYRYGLDTDTPRAAATAPSSPSGHRNTSVTDKGRSSGASDYTRTDKPRCDERGNDERARGFNERGAEKHGASTPTSAPTSAPHQNLGQRSFSGDTDNMEVKKQHSRTLSVGEGRGGGGGGGGGGDGEDSRRDRVREKQTLRRAASSFETMRSGSAMSAGVDGQTEIDVEMFLLPQEEQVRIHYIIRIIQQHGFFLSLFPSSCAATNHITQCQWYGTIYIYLCVWMLVLIRGVLCTTYP